MRVEELVKVKINKIYPGFQLYVSAFDVGDTITDTATASERNPTLLELDRT